MPASRCSSSSNSRSDRSSRSRSASLFLLCHQLVGHKLRCHQFTSVLLGGGPHHTRYRFGHLFPLRFFGNELLPAFIRKAVILEFPIAIRRSLPFGDDPSPLLQAMQRWIERAVLHLQEFIRSPLNVLPNLVTVSRSIEKRSQDEHVKRSLEESDPLLHLLFHRRHSTLNLSNDGRCSTIDCQRTKQSVDSRLTTS